jgi:pyrroline-5-carboxylate reductase
LPRGVLSGLQRGSDIGVASPEGTTERALNGLVAPDAWPKLMSEAIPADTARSR